MILSALILGYVIISPFICPLLRPLIKFCNFFPQRICSSLVGLIPRNLTIWVDIVNVIFVKLYFLIILLRQNNAIDFRNCSQIDLPFPLSRVFLHFSFSSVICKLPSQYRKHCFLSIPSHTHHTIQPAFYSTFRSVQGRANRKN